MGDVQSLSVITSYSIHYTKLYDYAFDVNMSSIPDSNDYTYFNPTCGGNQTVHFWASDSCNNKTIDSAVIWIIDNIPPVIVPASNQTADCNSMEKNTHPDYLAWLDSHSYNFV